MFPNLVKPKEISSLLWRDIQVALSCVQVIVDDLRSCATDIKVRSKHDATPVTDLDEKISLVLVKEYGEQNCATEEHDNAGVYGKPETWLCDPIDGTKSLVKLLGRICDPAADIDVLTEVCSISISIAHLGQDGVDRAVVALPLFGGSTVLVCRDGQFAPFMLKLSLSGDNAGLQPVVLPRTEHVCGKRPAPRLFVTLPGYDRDQINQLVNGAAREVLGYPRGYVSKIICLACPEIDNALRPVEIAAKPDGSITVLPAHDYAAAAYIAQGAGLMVTDLCGNPLSYSKGRKGCIVSCCPDVHKTVLQIAGILPL